MTDFSKSHVLYFKKHFFNNMGIAIKKLIKEGHIDDARDRVDAWNEKYGNEQKYKITEEFFKAYVSSYKTGDK